MRPVAMPVCGLEFASGVGVEAADFLPGPRTRDPAMNICPVSSVVDDTVEVITCTLELQSMLVQVQYWAKSSTI